MDKLKEEERTDLPVPSEEEETGEFSPYAEKEPPAVITPDSDPFPDGDPPSDAAAVDRPVLRGGVGKYILLFICAVLGAFAVIAAAVGISGAMERAGFSFPAFLYGEVVNSGLTEIPKNGDGVILTGRIRVPAAPSVSEDGTGPKPGALEAEGEDAGDGAVPGDAVALPILPVDLSADDPFALINETDYYPDAAATAGKERAIPPAAELYAEYGEGAPLVLIVHTHGTESYSPDGAAEYSSADTFRSLDPEDSVVAVGATVKRVLEDRGIGVIHCTSMFDASDFSAAYPSSAAEVARVLSEHPSVKYVLDVHRDALITAEGVNLRPVTETEDGDAAQIMIVVGTDNAGADHPGWEDNLSLALKVQAGAAAVCPSLMRAVDLRRESFNQQLAPGFLLVEAGAAANSLPEAKRAAAIFADALADIILGK